MVHWVFWDAYLVTYGHMIWKERSVNEKNWFRDDFFVEKFKPKILDRTR